MTYLAGSSDGRNFDLQEVSVEFNPKANEGDWDYISKFWRTHVKGRFNRYAVNVIFALDRKKAKKQAETAWNNGERHFRGNALT